LTGIDPRESFDFDKEGDLEDEVLTSDEDPDLNVDDAVLASLQVQTGSTVDDSRDTSSVTGGLDDLRLQDKLNEPVDNLATPPMQQSSKWPPRDK
jgi:hypothetical protein